MTPTTPSAMDQAQELVERVLNWYEGHRAESPALRDELMREIARVLSERDEDNARLLKANLGLAAQNSGLIRQLRERERELDRLRTERLRDIEVQHEREREVERLREALENVARYASEPPDILKTLVAEALLTRRPALED